MSPTAVAMLARAELRRSLRTLVALGLLAGVTAGIALTAAQVGRRTSTAYDRLEAASGTADAVVLVLGGSERAQAVADLPSVETSWLARSGVARVAGDQLRYLGLVAGTELPPPGLFTPVFVDGGPPDPRHASDLVLSERLAEDGGWSVGDRVHLDFLTVEEITQFDTGFGEPDGPSRTMRVVGIVRTGGDGTTNASEAYSGPALAQLLTEGNAGYFNVFVQLRGGAAGLARFERQVDRLSEQVTPTEGATEFLGYEVQVPGRERSVVDVTTRVLVIGLIGFAAIVGVAGLLTCGLALRRQLGVSTLEPRTLAALGSTNGQRRLGQFAGTAPFVVVGTVTGLLVALALSGLSPIGSIADQEPAPGWSPNVALLVVGTVLVALALTAVAAVAVFAAPLEPVRRHPSAIVRRLAARGTAPPVVLGTRFALEPGRGRTSVPVRSVRVACAVGVTALVAVLVWSSSLGRLVDDPHRWGWVADARVVDVTDDDVEALVADARITAVGDVAEVTVDVEGRSAPADAITDRKGSVGWTVLDGRMPRDLGEILLGARLARDLDRSVGDRVTATGREGDRARLDVVGVGVSGRSYVQFGGDVVITPADVERVARTDPFRSADVTFRRGVDADAVRTELGTELELSTPTRPPDVDNLAQLGALPWLLAAVLAVLVLAVLFHFLITTVRRRRREFDTLRAMGLRPRQTRRVVVVSGLVVAGVGIAVGVPLGIIIGRFAWRVTAHAVYVAGDLHVQVVAVLMLVLAALVATLAVTAWPAHLVTRGRVARGLRDE